MKITAPVKYFTLIAMVLGLAVGCAAQPEEPMPTAEVPEVEGLSAEAQQALEDARAAVAEAKSLGFIWKSTEKILKQAEEAAAAGDSEKTIELARKAEFEANQAVNQYYLEQAKMMMDFEISRYSGLTPDQQARVDQIKEAIRNSEGRRAYDMARALLEELKASMLTYEVVRGDSLWAISGKSDIYADPYQWPLIYKANSGKIEDPDLIYPGQQFDIDRNPSSAAVDAAVEHARTRGAWSLGVVEESDKRYLRTAP